jgi:cellulose synthase/poly-beta-1,6-N-acetylglucosamine synthase-like glycosyltransferase
MIEALFLISFSFYFARVLFFVLGSRKGRIESNDNYTINFPFVSIIVPARNESNNIIMCLDSICRSDYPIEKYEIIVVNDRSTDTTQQLVENYILHSSNIRLINVKNENEKTVKGKPGALDLGIKSAKGEYILMTDADCEVNAKWISSIVKTFVDKKSDQVAAFTLVKHKTFFDKYQAVEWILMHTMASGGIGYKFPLGCFGNNTAIKKDMYLNLGGYGNLEFSVTEDLALLQAVHKANGKIDYICSKDSTVRTLPIKGIRDYLKQRKRWAIGGKKLGWKAFLFVLASLLIWISFIASLTTGNYLLAISILLLKLITDAILVIPSILTVKENGLFAYLLPVNMLFLVIELILPFLLINKKVEWKGQIFD